MNDLLRINNKMDIGKRKLFISILYAFLHDILLEEKVDIFPNFTKNR